MEQLIMIPLVGKPGCGKTTTLNKLAEFFSSDSISFKKVINDSERLDYKQANVVGDFNYAFSIEGGKQIVTITTSGDTTEEVESNTRFFERIIKNYPNAKRYYWFLASHTKGDSFDAVAQKEWSLVNPDIGSSVKITDRYWFYKDHVWIQRQDKTNLSKEYYEFLNNSCAEELFKLFLELKKEIQ